MGDEVPAEIDRPGPPGPAHPRHALRPDLASDHRGGVQQPERGPALHEGPRRQGGRPPLPTLCGKRIEPAALHPAPGQRRRDGR